MPKALELFALEELRSLSSRGLLRAPDDGLLRERAAEAAASVGLPLVDASSNDYLGLASLDVSRETGVQGAHVGAGASRLIHGSRPPHLALERAVADWLRQESALLFSSGFAANLGLLTAIGTPGTVILSDRLNHASIIDGCRLSGAEVKIVPHLDDGALARALADSRNARARWVVTESCFSMDGDGPDLEGLRGLCDEYGAGLVVDEAHSLGVFGLQGAGRCVAAGVSADAVVGTLGKAVGSQGAFVATSSAVRDLLWNRARSFVFSTATSPLLAQHTLLHVERVRMNEAARTALWDNIATLEAALTRFGVAVSRPRRGPIFPIIVGDNELAVEAAGALAARGILVQAIRPPTVPQGGARLRVTVSAGWPSGAPERVAEGIASVIRP
jgi:8-amino-7-oxononanoate synthase